MNISLFNYSIKEDKILRSFNPNLVAFSLVYNIFCELFYLSILVSYSVKLDGGFLMYSALYSYWGVTLAAIASLYSIISASMRLHAFYYRKELFKEKSFHWWLNFVDVFRDCFIIVSILQLCLSSGTFWIFCPFDWAYGFPTIMSHYIVLVLVVILYFITIVYVSWWNLALALCFCGVYYSFTILVYYVTDGWWVYSIQDPKVFPVWFLILILSVIAQMIIYFIISIINIIKNKIYVALQVHILEMPIVKQKIEFAIGKQDHLNIEILLTSVIMLFVGICNMIIVIWSLFMVTEYMEVVIVIFIIVEIISGVLSLLTSLFGVSYVVNNNELWVLQIIKKVNMLLIIVNGCKFVAGVVLFFVTLPQKVCWVFLAILIFSMISFSNEIILEYFIWTRLTTNENSVVYKSLFYHI